MSTRSSLAHHESFHFYHDLMDDDDTVYLTLREPCGHNTSIAIPIAIWETIRHLGGARFDYADKTDQDLLDEVSKAVDERIDEYNSAETEDKKSLLAFFGSGVFGDGANDRQTQIRDGLEHFKRIRAHQQEVRRKMGEYKIFGRDE